MEPHAARVVTLTFMEPEAARDADVRIKRDQSEGRQRAAGAPAALPDHGSGGGGADLSRKLVTAAVSGDDPSGELSLIKEEVQVRVKGYVSVECEVQMRPVPVMQSVIGEGLDGTDCITWWQRWRGAPGTYPEGRDGTGWDGAGRALYL